MKSDASARLRLYCNEFWNLRLSFSTSQQYYALTHWLIHTQLVYGYIKNYSKSIPTDVLTESKPLLTNYSSHLQCNIVIGEIIN